MRALKSVIAIEAEILQISYSVSGLLAPNSLIPFIKMSLSFQEMMVLGLASQLETTPLEGIRRYL